MQEVPERQKKGQPHRDGLFHCPDCRGQFTVRTGQVMERSHVPLAKWVLAYHLMASSKKGVSAHQLHRSLKVAYNTAWFMAHGIREAMVEKNPTPLGGEGKIVEADEMYHGKRETPAQLSRGRVRKPTKKGRSGPAQKREVIGLAERGAEARIIHVNHITAKNLREHVVKSKRWLQTTPSCRHSIRGPAGQTAPMIKRSPLVLLQVILRCNRTTCLPA